MKDVKKNKMKPVLDADKSQLISFIFVQINILVVWKR